MGRVRAGLAAAASAGVVLAAVPSLLPDEPLPTLRNGAGWAGAAPFAAERTGEALMRPFGDVLWLARGRTPGEGDRAVTVRTALLDLRRLTRPNGAVAAGPDGPWAYTWPRDTSFVAVAYAVSGHPDEAWRALDFLASVQHDDGGFEARYLLDGSGVPDDRPRQSDGAGWVLWALDATRVASGGDPLPAGLQALRDRATDFVLGLTEGGLVLPPVSPDYWEVPERRLTLGTAAPLVAGLEAASRTYAAEGAAARAADVARAAVRLRELVRDHFGPDYERHGGSGGLDASVAMLMPPFAEEGEAAARAWSAYPQLALRSAGGIAPGVDWKQDGVSWTPETALVAYTAAASGRVDAAEQWLEWLGAHVTPWGSLPEKVLPDGRPAGPAPLAWTAALVVLTEHELGARLQTVGPEVLGVEPSPAG
jgi:GH15 family glucan-1,4-alpha-glucosidase